MQRFFGGWFDSRNKMSSRRNNAAPGPPPGDNGTLNPQEVEATINQASNGPMTRSKRKHLEETLFSAGTNQQESRENASAAQGTSTNDTNSRSGQPKMRRISDSKPANSQPTKPDHRIKETMSERRFLVAEQNDAYEKSLLADMEKDRVKQEKEKAEEERKRKLKQRQAQARELLPEEPSDNETVISIAFRFMSGVTVRRNFLPSDTLITLNQFVLSLAETPLEYEVVRYPNQTLPQGESCEAEITLEEYGFNKREMLHVRQIVSNNIGAGDS